MMTDNIEQSDRRLRKFIIELNLKFYISLFASTTYTYFIYYTNNCSKTFLKSS